MSENSWGGYRPGSGQKPKWNSGATTVIRVPESLAEATLAYARLVDGQFPAGLQVDTALACELPQALHETATQSNQLAALELELAKVKAERDALKQESQELAAKVGDLQLRLDKTRSQPSPETVT